MDTPVMDPLTAEGIASVLAEPLPGQREVITLALKRANGLYAESKYLARLATDACIREALWKVCSFHGEDYNRCTLNAAIVVARGLLTWFQTFYVCSKTHRANSGLAMSPYSAFLAFGDEYPVRLVQWVAAQAQHTAREASAIWYERVTYDYPSFHALPVPRNLPAMRVRDVVHLFTDLENPDE